MLTLVSEEVPAPSLPPNTGWQKIKTIIRREFTPLCNKVITSFLAHTNGKRRGFGSASRILKILRRAEPKPRRFPFV